MTGSGVTPEDDGLVYARQLMCSPGGRDWVERIVLRPFGYTMISRDAGDAVEQLRSALAYYAKPRAYGSDEHSVFLDDGKVARRALGGLLDGPLHDLSGEADDVGVFDAAMAEEGPNVPFDPYGPTDEHPFGLSKAEVHPWE